jgi:1-acyl-sn-glycerol-3-phosphate acyltransferase
MPTLELAKDQPRQKIPVTAKWDPDLAKRVVDFLRPIAKRYFRSEVKDLGRIPVGGALLVSNHSGGSTTTDLPTFAVDYYDRFGYDRPLYTLSHDILSIGPTRRFLQQVGVIPASRENAARALADDAAVMVFPGGDYDATRPTLAQNVIDFNGRTGYVRTAVEAGVPIVPIVSIGGQETQFFLTRGTWLAKQLGIKRLTRSEIVPISVGFPFGMMLGGMNLPLPSKIVTQVLPAIDITARFGEDPDIAEVDAYVRGAMQKALNRLAAQRRFPVLG